MKLPLGYNYLLAPHAIIRAHDQVRCVKGNRPWEYPFGLLGNRVCRATGFGWEVCRKGNQAQPLEILQVEHRWSLGETKQNLAAQTGLTVRQITEIVG